jgi:hypothetical protein
MASIRIRSVPPGEAPESVRAAWVGLELPLLRERPLRYLGSGVLTGPRGVVQLILHLATFRLKVLTGFVVPSKAAIEVLERSDPGAARWWRENAPHTLRPGRHFLFPPECCEKVDSD